MDFAEWAQRRTGKHDGDSDAPVAAAPPAPVALSAPPAGYAWAVHQGQYVLVQLQQSVEPAPRQPGAVPFVPAPTTFHPGTQHPQPGVASAPRIRTCTLVKPGNRDTYAELLATVPDLAPPQGFDAMAGRVDPRTQDELSGLPEYGSPDQAPMAYPTTGSHAPVAAVAPLKAG